MRQYGSIDTDSFSYINSGGFSKISKTRIDGKEFAIKENNNDYNRVCINELDIGFRLRHNYLVHYHGVIINRGFLFVMDLADGTLFEYAKTKPDNLLLCFYQVALGLKFLHDNNILHLDVNPYNVLMFNGVAKLNDFSLCVYTIDEYVTDDYLITEPYRPPECWTNKLKIYDRSSDIWSFAMTMVQCYSTEVLLKAKSRKDALSNSDVGLVVHKVKDKRVVPLLLRMLCENKRLRPDIETVCKTLESILGFSLPLQGITLKTTYPSKKASFNDYCIIFSMLRYCMYMRYKSSDVFLAIDIYHRTTCTPDNIRAAASIALMRKVRYRCYSYEQLNILQVNQLETKILEKQMIIELNGLINTPTLWDYLKNERECIDSLMCLLSAELYVNSLKDKKTKYIKDYSFLSIFTKSELYHYNESKLEELYLKQNANK